MSKSTNPLSDPALTVARKSRRTVEEIIHEKHVHHMKELGQDKWLANLLAKADKMRAEHEAASNGAKPNGAKKNLPKKKGN